MSQKFINCKSITLSRGFWFQALGDWYLSHSKLPDATYFWHKKLLVSKIIPIFAQSL